MHHLEPLSGALRTSGGTFKFQTFTSKYRATVLKPLNLYVRPVSGTFMYLYVEPFNLDVELLFILGPAKLHVNLKTTLTQKNFPRVYIQPKGEVVESKS